MKLKKYIFKNYLNEDINYLDEDINFLISMSTYPRNFKSTKLLIKESLDTLLADLPINFKPFLLIVGDDYNNIYFELKDLIDEGDGLDVAMEFIEDELEYSKIFRTHILFEICSTPGSGSESRSSRRNYSISSKGTFIGSRCI